MKFLNKKRIASAALAGTLALSMVTPAFASEKTTNITGSVANITLSVAVPTTGKAVINPYGLPYTVGEGVSITGEKIVTAAPLTVQNLSSVPLDVNVSIVGTKTGNFAFEATGTTLGSTETGNKGVVFFEIFDALALNATTIENTDTLISEFAKLKSTDAADRVQIKGVAGTPDTKDAVIKLREADAQNSTLQAGGAAFFRLAGDVVKKPATAWATTDGFTAAIAFTFEPSATPYTQSAGSIADGSGLQTPVGDAVGSIGLTGAKLTLTPTLPDGLTPTAANTMWTVDNTDDFTITPDNTDPLKATVKKATSTTAASQTGTVTVTITDTNGIPYVATVDVTTA